MTANGSAERARANTQLEKNMGNDELNKDTERRGDGSGSSAVVRALGLHPLDKLTAEYQRKLDDLDVCLHAEKELRSKARRAGDPDDEIAIRSADITGLNKLRQAYVQFIKDLDAL